MITDPELLGIISKQWAFPVSRGTAVKARQTFWMRMTQHSTTCCPGLWKSLTFLIKWNLTLLRLVIKCNTMYAEGSLIPTTYATVLTPKLKKHNFSILSWQKITKLVTKCHNSFNILSTNYPNSPLMRHACGKNPIPPCRVQLGVNWNNPVPWYHLKGIGISAGIVIS